LVDAYHVAKLLSQQLLPFGRSCDELGELTFGVEQFLPMSVRRRQSVRRWQTVRESSVRRVFFVFLLGFAFDPFLLCVLVGRSFGRSTTEARTVCGCLADGPRAPRGRSVFRGSLLEVLLALTDSPRLRAGRSAVRVRTVRGSRPDGPRGPCGQSAPPGRTVRQSLAALFLGSVPPFFLSCFHVCFKEPFLRLEVDP
jgi:hypothetical protein